jgi:hypothetical protein
MLSSRCHFADGGAANASATHRLSNGSVEVEGGDAAKGATCKSDIQSMSVAKLFGFLLPRRRRCRSPLACLPAVNRSNLRCRSMHLQM